MCSTENAATTKQQTPTSTINKKKKLLYRYLCAVKTWPNEIRAVRYLTFTVAFFLRYRTTSVRYSTGTDCSISNIFKIESKVPVMLVTL